MSSTDDRIVRMQFDNAQFKRGAAETQKSLTDLDRSIQTAGKGAGLMSLNGVMQKVSVSAEKMAIITTTAIANITNRAVNAGVQLANSLTLDPVRQGFAEYESLLTKQNVIMNATGKSAKEVKKTLAELNTYSDKTIYSFGDMTSAVQKFVNAGVDLDTATTTIKGIANAAAFAGANSEEAGRAMYAFSQSMSLGHIMLQDWNQIENANLGTQKFKNELLKAGVAAGTLTKSGDGFLTKSGKYVSATKGWRDGLQEQWATTEVLNKALGKYADTNTKLGAKAFKAAQDVRTFSAFMQTLKESLGSGWANIFTTLIGGLDESTKMWTGLSNTVGKSVHDFFAFTNTALATWKALGGGAKVMEGLRNIASPFVALFHAIGDAWQAAFPTTGKSAGSVLYDMSSAFATLTKPLTWVARLITALTPALTYFFKTIKMGASGLKQIATDIGELAEHFAELVNLDLPSGSGVIEKFFKGLFGGVAMMYEKGVDLAHNLLEGIVSVFSSGATDTTANILGTGLIAAIFYTLRKAIKGGFGFNFSLFGDISESLGLLTGTLKAMQTQLQAKTLQNIAVAIALLTASVVALSMIDDGKLKKALGAMAVGFGQLLLAMGILVKISGAAGFVKVPLIAAAMVGLATSILILTGAIALMGQLKWETIGKGLAGIGGALVVIAAGMKLMPKSMVITAAGLVLVSVALNGIAAAIAIMGNLEWETIGKGLATTAGALVIIAGAMRLMPLSMPVTAAGLVLVGIALNGVATALKIMGSMSWEDIAQGLTALGGAIAILAVGLNAMSATGVLGAAALVVAATGINILVPALLIMSKMKWEGIAKAMTGLAGGLAILAGGLYLMTGAIPGALALLIVAPALLMLSTVMIALSALSWEDIGQSLVALAAGLTVIGLAGLLIGPVVPALLGLGAALALMGLGLALAGAGILAFTTALGILVAMGAGAVSYLSKYVMAFLGLLPEMGRAFALLIVEFIQAIVDNAPVFIEAFITMITGLIVAADKLLPRLAVLFYHGLTLVLKVLRKAIPDIADAGLDILIALINELTAHMDELTDAGADLIVAFIEGIGDNNAKIVKAAIETITEFVIGILGEIAVQGPKIIDAMADLGGDMMEGLGRGIGKMAFAPHRALKGVLGGLVDGAKELLDSHSPSRVFIEIGKFIVDGLTIGIQDNASSAIVAVASMMSLQIATANEYISKMIQDMDQKTMEARARADGLAAAAEAANKAANKTKSKKDDKAANRIGKSAEKAEKEAEKLQEAADKEKEKQDRADEFAKAGLLGKAQMRSEDAQTALDRVKAEEAEAAMQIVQANALDKQSKAAGVNRKQRRALRKLADDLRKKAAENAVDAEAALEEARVAAADALNYQKLAGDAAAAAFQKMFDADAKADADEKAFNKLSNSDKAAQRRLQAIELQKKADEDLAAAKLLAYTDIEAANELAQKAQEEANQARAYLDEAAQLGSSAAGGGVTGTVVNLAPTEAAAIAMNEYSDLFDLASGAAASSKTVEFNQYNTSPEALSPTEIYRQTNNLFAFAVDKIDSDAEAA